MFKLIPVRLAMLNLHYILLVHLYILYDCVYFLIHSYSKRIFHEPYLNCLSEHHQLTLLSSLWFSTV